MKDTQIATSGAEPRIFLVSAALHCVSMTALVYLRSSFGFAYLRPKSVFFAFSWAFVLYAIYASMEVGVWRDYRAVLWFGIGAMGLYWFHLLTVIRREWRGTATHDNFSGKSNFNATAVKWKGSDETRFEQRLRLWGEPVFVTVAAIFLRFVVGERHLSLWLAFTGVCLWIKEALNHWYRIRQRKRRQDILDDAEDAFDGQSDRKPAPQSLKPSTRKARVHRARMSSSTDEDRR